MQQYLTPLAIIIGFTMVAGAIYSSGFSYVEPRAADPEVVGAATDKTAPQIVRNPIRLSDRHIYGNVDAPTVIVEFSDLECPFCARVHPTLKQIVDESDGQIAWEYRHFPLPNHAGAETAAIISECVAREIGNDAFWQFLDAIFVDGANSVPAYRAAAQSLGLSEAQIDACMTDETIAKLITDDMTVTRALGGNGTPFSIIKKPDGTLQPISGALPYAQWMSALQ